VLQDGAFESGMPFDSEVLADEGELRQEIADDFWRRTFHDASPLLASHLLRRKLDPEALLGVVSSHHGRHDLHVLVPEDPGDLALLEATCMDTFAAAKAAWRRDEVERLLLEHPGLNRNSYRIGSIPKWIERADAYLAAELPDLKPFDKLDRLTVAAIEAMSQKPAPAHAFFGACGAMLEAVTTLATAYERRMAIAQRDLLDFCRAELVARKQRLQAQSFDDLLTQLAAALRGPRGERLAATIRERWPAALVDEFQDTDPVQFGIFRAIYDGTDAPVFLVGDPKQAIYSFRGADIFAYLEARRGAGRRFPLDVNWRSDPSLIAAVNAVFAGAKRPFMTKEIEFLPARPAPRDDRDELRIAGEPILLVRRRDLIARYTE
jgi:exodeoxyribonuclease V beta subunit